jgi:hypothetical protein
MRLTNHSIAVLLLGVLPLFFLDLSRWVVDIPPELHAFAHVAFFGFLALLLMELPGLRHSPFVWRASKVMLTVLLIGITIELIQPLLGRSAGLGDIRQNLIGALAVVSLYTPSGVLRTLAAGVAFVFVVLELTGPGVGLWDRYVARMQFPVLSDFETRFEHHRWSSGVPDPTVARVGRRSLRVELTPGAYAGTTLLRSFGDWNGHDHVELSIYNPDDDLLPITVSIRDREHFERGGLYDDRYNGHFVVGNGWNDLRLPVSAIRYAPARRTLDLSDLSEMVIFSADLRHSRIIHVDRVRLTSD